MEKTGQTFMSEGIVDIPRGIENGGGQVGECVSTLYLCRMEEKMTVPLCVSVPGLCWGLDR